MRQLVWIIIVFSVGFPALGQQQLPDRQLLFEDDFSGVLDTTHWLVEKQAGDAEIVNNQEGKLLLDTDGGVTVWFKKELQGNVLITFKRKVIMAGGKHDRLSDLNQFWMATDPNLTTMFTRSGRFPEYDSLDMYYVGMGGNYNSTTRFRKYKGGDKKLVSELNDSTHLLQPNKVYEIACSIQDGCVKFMVDSIVYFSWKDEHPYTHGYFGFRSTKSRQEIDDLKIYQLK